MASTPRQQNFFIQDPFTEDVKGPLDAQQLKQWFAQGAVGDWGVSKSQNGPWTPAAQVKGLAPSKASEPPQRVATQSEQPTVVKAEPSLISSPMPAASRTSFQALVDSFFGKAKQRYPAATPAIEWAEQHFPKSFFGRAAVAVAGLWLSLLLVCVVLLGVGTVWSETFGNGAKSRQAVKEAEEAAIRADKALETMGEQAHKAMEQLEGGGYRQRVIRDAEYKRAKRELGR